MTGKVYLAPLLLALVVAAALSLLLGSRPLPRLAPSPVAAAFAVLAAGAKPGKVQAPAAGGQFSTVAADQMQNSYFTAAAAELKAPDPPLAKPHLDYPELRLSPPDAYPQPREPERRRDVCARYGGKRVDHGRRWHCVYAHRRRHRHG